SPRCAVRATGTIVSGAGTVIVNGTTVTGSVSSTVRRRSPVTAVHASDKFVATPHNILRGRPRATTTRSRAWAATVNNALTATAYSIHEPIIAWTSPFSPASKAGHGGAEDRRTKVARLRRAA